MLVEAPSGQFRKDNIVIIHLLIDELAHVEQIHCQDNIERGFRGQFDLLLLPDQIAEILDYFFRGGLTLYARLHRHLS